MKDSTKILLVDDCTISLSVTSRLFRTLGLNVDVANNGLEAIAMVEANDYDLVLMDIQMPEMNGLEATRVIRSLKSPKCDIKIVAMTGCDSEEDLRLIKLAGMNDYVAKPMVVVEFFKKMDLIASRKIPVFDYGTRRAEIEKVH